MKVNNKLIAELSQLARLNFDKKTIKKMKSDLKDILKFVDKLSEINTDGVAPLKYLSKEKNILRSDQIDKKLEQEDALKNAPEKDSDYFKVPKVLKK